MKLRHGWFVTSLMTGLLTLGCGGDPSGSISLAPAKVKLLTCSSQSFEATASGLSSSDVAWSMTPATAGTLKDGVLTTATEAPSPITATVTATSTADPSVSGAATVTIATAFPSAASPIESAVLEPGNMPGSLHALASNGARVYAVYVVQNDPDDPETDDLLVVRSDDGGKTWGEPSSVNGSTEHAFSCASMAVDPANPDLLHVVYLSSQAQGLFPSLAGVEMTNGALVIATSTDGGKTFTNRPVVVAGAADQPFDVGANFCPDVAAPSADAVVIAEPGDKSTDTDPDVPLFVDTQAGSGFDGGGTVDDTNYVSAEYNPALAQANDYDGVEGSNQSPRLFTDGKGNLCATWVARHDGEIDSTQVACSADSGATWSAPVTLNPGDPNETLFSAGAFAPDGEVAVVYVTISPDLTREQLEIAWSDDGGQSFGAPRAIAAPDLQPGPETVSPTFDSDGVLWLAYQTFDGITDATYVDKSCDEGATWSGPVEVDPGEDRLDAYIVPTPGTPLIATFHRDDDDENHLTAFSLAP